MLKIENLTGGIENKVILNNLNLEIKKGEFHVIMGRNGTGKSTLANILSGKENYLIKKGNIIFNKYLINKLSAEERACKGMFMSFQYPVSIPGVNSMHFLRQAVNSIRKYQNKKELDPSKFIKLFKSKLKDVGLDESFTKRSVNDGFSGGEKKRFEILQMLILEPKLIILDETDSGLDIDAIKIVSKSINNYKSKNTSFLLITHYHRILKYLKPDYVHVLLNGTIVKTGSEKLAIKLEKDGYSWLD